MNHKYQELDGQITKKIMSEFKGKVVESKCPNCKGSGKIGLPQIPCSDCDSSGIIKYKY